ncbi:hypothetical protein Tco_0303147 [Tanacetum coccineum]
MQLFENEDSHAHIRWFNKITSTIKYRDVPNSSIKLMIFPFSIEGAAQIWLEKEPPRSILTWEDLDRFKDLLRACSHHGFTKLHQLDTFYNALTPTDQDSLNAAAGGNLLTKTPRHVVTNIKEKDKNQVKTDKTEHEIEKREKPKNQHALTIIENKSKVRNSRNKSIVTKVSTNVPSSSTPHSPEIAALVDAVKAMLHQKSSHPASMKAVEEICVTCGGPHPYHQCLATDGNVFLEYRDKIQGYVLAAAINYNQGNTGYRPQSVANQIRPPGFAQLNVQNNQSRYNQGYNQNRGNNQGNLNYQTSIQQTQVAPSNELSNYKKINDANMKAMQNQINNVKNELRNEMQTSMSMASFFQMNTASSSGSGSLYHNLWDVIINGDLEEEHAPTGETSTPPAPKTAKQLAAKRNQERVKSILLLAIPDEYLLKFHNVACAKSLWEAIKSRFGGNKESKKMQKKVLKHQFENFSTASNESLDKAYDRFQKLISQLEVHGAPISKEDIN